ncbi:CBN-SRV-15 protein [Aphelenchoides avenae]|nr:CBN-SRV-15 protein [Aphelenchus avenae]
MLNTYVCSAFPRWGWFPLFYLDVQSPLLHLYFILAYGAGVAQAICADVVALNRVTAILFMHKYGLIWSTRKLHLAITLQIVPALIVGAITLKDHVRFVTDDAVHLISTIVETSATDLYFKLAAAFYAVNSTLIIVMYAVVLYMLRRTRHEPKARRNAQHRAQEFRLFILSSIICFIQVTLAVFYFVKQYLGTDDFYVYFNLLSDVYSGINPYLLWAFSEPLRMRTYALLRIPIGRSNRVVRVTSVCSGRSFRSQSP